MNSKNTSAGFEMSSGFNFMGRSGVKLVKGLRVAFLSGIDFDVLGSADMLKSESFYGNYFTEGDLQNVLSDYNLIVKNDPLKREGVDLFLTS